MMQAIPTEPVGFEEHSFRVADGLEIAYRDYAPTIPERGVPVLCLHGLTRNVRDFEEFAPRVAGLGRRVIVAEQRGRGRSSWDPEPSRYLPLTYTHDMIALLDALQLPRVVAVGTSMGGLMTMILATIAPGRLAAAILNDIGPEIAEEGLTRIQGYVGGEASVVSWAQAADATRTINGDAFPDEQGDAFWLTFAKRLWREEEPGRIVLDYDPAIAGPVRGGDVAPVDLWPFFDALADAPCLLVRGALSDLLTRETVDRMRARRPDLAFAEVPRVGHAPFLTEQRAWTAVEAFLGALAE